MADRIITVVHPRPTLPSPTEAAPKKRIAAYARVSTDSDEQMGSVEAQKDYFQKLIHNHPGWELVDVYTDEGISGTSIRRREAFNRMINDALSGKIDMIITKSLSRFARNTVDALNTIRKLKDVGVGVYFEKENIDTLDSKGEFILTLMSSLAEEESRSISENVKWGMRKAFADGKYSLPYKQFLGYKKGTDGLPELVEAEATTIRLIYRLSLNGYSPSAIATKLSEAGILSPAGHETWTRSTIKSILRNEKYYGAALLQKTHTIDFRTKKRIINNGELPKYYIENDHKPIVTKEIFDEVQVRFKHPPHKHSSSLLFANKLFCADCGSPFGTMPIHSTTYNDIVWKCSNRHLRKYDCTSPYLYEELLKPIFHEIILSILTNTPGIIRECVKSLKTADMPAHPLTRSTIINAVTVYDINSENEQRTWRSIIDKVTVHQGHLLEFHIIDGSLIRYQMQKTSPRMRRLPIQTKAQILQMHSEGLSSSVIGKELGISTSTVRSIINRKKLTLS